MFGQQSLRKSSLSDNAHLLQVGLHLVAQSILGTPAPGCETLTIEELCEEYTDQFGAADALYVPCTTLRYVVSMHAHVQLVSIVGFCSHLPIHAAAQCQKYRDREIAAFICSAHTSIK